MTKLHDSSPRTPAVTGERIAQLLWRNNLTIASLAREVGRDRSLFSLKMNGLRRWYLDELLEGAETLDTTVGYLLGETDDDKRPAHLRGHEEAPKADAEGAEEWARRGSNPRPAD